MTSLHAHLPLAHSVSCWEAEGAAARRCSGERLGAQPVGPGGPRPALPPPLLRRWGRLLGPAATTHSAPGAASIGKGAQCASLASQPHQPPECALLLHAGRWVLIGTRAFSACTFHSSAPRWSSCRAASPCSTAPVCPKPPSLTSRFGSVCSSPQPPRTPPEAATGRAAPAAPRLPPCGALACAERPHRPARRRGRT